MLARQLFSIAGYIKPKVNRGGQVVDIRELSIADQLAELTEPVLKDAAAKGQAVRDLLIQMGVYDSAAPGGINTQALTANLPSLDSSGSNLAKGQDGKYMVNRSQTQGLNIQDGAVYSGLTTLGDILTGVPLKDANPVIMSYIAAAEMVEAANSQKPWRPKVVAGADGNAAGPSLAALASGRPEMGRNSGLLVSMAAGAGNNTRDFIAQIMSDKLGNEATQRRIFKNNSSGIADIPGLVRDLQNSIANTDSDVKKNAIKGPQTIDAYDFPSFLHAGTILSSSELQAMLLDAARPYYRNLDGSVNEQGMVEDMATLLQVTLDHSKEQAVSREHKAGQKYAMHFGEYLDIKGPRGVTIPVGSAGLREINNGHSTTVHLPNGEAIKITDKEVAKGVTNVKKPKKVSRFPNTPNTCLLYTSPSPRDS